MNTSTKSKTTAKSNYVVYGGTPNPPSKEPVTIDGSIRSNSNISNYFPEKPEAKHLIREELAGITVRFLENKSGKEFTAVIDKARGPTDRFYAITFSKGFEASNHLTGKFSSQTEAQRVLRHWIDNPESGVTYIDCDRRYDTWTR